MFFFFFLLESQSSDMAHIINTMNELVTVFE